MAPRHGRSKHRTQADPAEQRTNAAFSVSSASVSALYASLGVAVTVSLQSVASHGDQEASTPDLMNLPSAVAETQDVSAKLHSGAANVPILTMPVAATTVVHEARTPGRQLRYLYARLHELEESGVPRHSPEVDHLLAELTTLQEREARTMTESIRAFAEEYGLEDVTARADEILKKHWTNPDA